MIGLASSAVMALVRNNFYAAWLLSGEDLRAAREGEQNEH
jgi:hypothetical protein